MLLPEWISLWAAFSAVRFGFIPFRGGLIVLITELTAVMTEKASPSIRHFPKDMEMTSPGSSNMHEKNEMPEVRAAVEEGVPNSRLEITTKSCPWCHAIFLHVRFQVNIRAGREVMAVNVAF